jgi:tetratricopeptide (TPR) repeat protein
MQQLASLFLLLLTLGMTQPISTQQESQSARLLEGLGAHHHPITTAMPEAQRFFDQGLILAFAFNHSEAFHSFKEAARLDPNCAMCYWGQALVLGPNINTPMDPADAPKAWAALQKAQARTPKASEREQSYIRALSKRYRPNPPEDRSALDRAYAEAMGEHAAQYPKDLDAQVLYAKALMDTTPWAYWQLNGEPKPVTETFLAVLESVLGQEPDHPMANHLYIHAVEAQHPERGLEKAKRLEHLVPGAGHLVHMPSHIYIRMGRYHDASQANQRAIAADKQYLEQVDVQGVYQLAYIPHNYHFLWFTATLEGRSEQAIQAARETAAHVDTTVMRERGLNTLQHYWITPLYALVRFGRWDEVLAWPEPAEELIYPRGVWHYARGMALTRKGEFDAARRELKSLQTLAGSPILEQVTLWDTNRSRRILTIATQALAGELEAATGDFEAAIASLSRAVEREDALNDDAPPPTWPPTWHYPIRQSLGAVLLQAGRPAEAVRIYQQDLNAFPNNGWSLFGLLTALRRQGRVEEAQEAEQRFREAWQHADITLTASRF